MSENPKFSTAPLNHLTCVSTASRPSRRPGCPSAGANGSSPKDVIGDERLPFSRAEKRFDVALQKRGGDGHARSPFRAETTLVAPSSASLAGIEPGQIQIDALPVCEARSHPIPRAPAPEIAAFLAHEAREDHVVHLGSA